MVLGARLTDVYSSPFRKPNSCTTEDKSAISEPDLPSISNSSLITPKTEEFESEKLRYSFTSEELDNLDKTLLKRKLLTLSKKLDDVFKLLSNILTVVLIILISILVIKMIFQKKK